MPTSATIVLLHGQPDSSASFWGLRAALRERRPDLRVLAPDRPGYGANAMRAGSYQDNVDWLLDWVGAHTDGPVTLLGHSWAGGVAILAAAQASERVNRLMLLSSVGPACLLPIDQVLGAPALGEVMAFGALQLGKPFISRRAASLIINRQAEPDRPYARASGMAMRFRPVWRSFLIEQRAMLTELPAIEAALPRISCPTLVISGQHDRLIPAATPIELAARIPGANATQLDGAHDLQLRQPELVADAVAGFQPAPALS